MKARGRKVKAPNHKALDLVNCRLLYHPLNPAEPPVVIKGADLVPVIGWLVREYGGRWSDDYSTWLARVRDLGQLTEWLDDCTLEEHGPLGALGHALRDYAGRVEATMPGASRHPITVEVGRPAGKAVA